MIIYVESVIAAVLKPFMVRIAHNCGFLQIYQSDRFQNTSKVLQAAINLDKLVKVELENILNEERPEVKLKDKVFG